ncbi:MAG: DUF3987 domain-containing protein [Planctomycetaceae bacterium]|nr:DUF3987 domain-containing protein [Planctomycetaceae bacterium]
MDYNAAVKASPRADVLAVDADGIPDELKALTQWVLWKIVVRDGKPTKEPFQVSGVHASSTNAATWTTFDDVYAAYMSGGYDGIGFVFAAGGGYVGIDFDGCRNPETGAIDYWAIASLEDFPSYAEISPTGTGVKVFIKGDLPTEKTGAKTGKHNQVPGMGYGGKKPGIEIYQRGRFFAVTGHALPEAPAVVVSFNGVLHDWFGRVFTPAPEDAKPISSSAPSVDRAKLVERAIAYLAKVPAAVSGQRGHDATFHAACICRSDYGLSRDESVSALADWNAKCDPPWSETDLLRKIDEAGKEPVTLRLANGRDNSRAEWVHDGGDRYARATVQAAPQEIAIPLSQPVAAGIELYIDAPNWPDPPNEMAFYGLAGDVARFVEPHTEADPVAILSQLLVAFGNAAGRNPYFVAEESRHHVNMFLTLVGQTAKGRKGSSWSRVGRLIESADETWSRDRIVNGLSTGEGLIHAVRDPVKKMKEEVSGGRTVGTYEYTADPGVDDKRLLVVEEEFARVLKVADRKENTISAIMRHAWDSGTLQTLTKNAPAKATNAHISIICHITQEELRHCISASDQANGFGNRFLWACVKRSKLLPDGGLITQDDMQPFVGRIQECLRFAATVGAMRRDAPAAELWRDSYAMLSRDRRGLYGKLVGRAEAQTMRLACIYALLDLSPVVEREHLRAALALWNYCEASAATIFGGFAGNKITDTILAALRGAPDGLNRTQICSLFQNHTPRIEIEQALMGIKTDGLAETETVPTKGRSAQRWKLTSAC